jgi:hypothetical protein
MQSNHIGAFVVATALFFIEDLSFPRCIDEGMSTAIIVITVSKKYDVSQRARRFHFTCCKLREAWLSKISPRSISDHGLFTHGFGMGEWNISWTFAIGH